MCHAPDYAAAVDLERGGLLVGHVGYPGYPFRCFWAGPILICLEGRVYNKDADSLDAELSRLAEVAREESAEAQSHLARWICQADGEYVVVLADPERRQVVAFTDPLGLLPLFYCCDGRGLLLSREIKFIRHLQGAWGFDRTGWAEFLTFGHPLGERTLFRDVHQAPAAALLRARLAGGHIRAEACSLVEINFAEKDRSGSSAQDHAAEMADLFVEACRRRGSQRDVSANVVSLSGGMDSRAVAAALAKGGCAFQAATSVRQWSGSEPDDRIAERLAKLLEAPWKLFEARRADQEQMDRLVRMKDGTNYVGMAHLLHFLEQILQTWGRRALLFTGNGGEMCFYDLRADRPVANLRDLAGEIIRDRAYMPPRKAEALTGLAPGSVTEQLVAVLSRYPEEHLAYRAVHHFVYGTGHKWAIHGEDRYRCYCWLTSPFYCFPWFRYAAGVPDGHKQHHRLYRLFQMRLSPPCARLPDATVGLPPASRLFPLKLRCNRLAHRLPGWVYALLRRALKRAPAPFQPSADQRAYLESELRPGRPLAGLLCPEALGQIVEEASELQFQHLWTLVTLERLLREGLADAPGKEAPR
jgi:asparagine synthase (glutamine-hydrolysing)